MLLANETNEWIMSLDFFLNIAMSYGDNGFLYSALRNMISGE